MNLKQKMVDNPGSDIPAKFRDPELGGLNATALLKSYRDLERRLARGDGKSPPSGVFDREAALKALGVPETPEQYRIELLEDFLERDREMEGLLHEAGFSETQVQLVYDLAATKLAPLIAEVVGRAKGAGDTARLEAEFGGRERWTEVRRQLRKWGEKHLPGDAFNALCCSYDGVKAMHRMMTVGDEPDLAVSGVGGAPLTETQLKKMMNDPRYWRDHDPVLMRKVEQGFRTLYPGRA